MAIKAMNLVESVLIMPHVQARHTVVCMFAISEKLIAGFVKGNASHVTHF